MQNVIRSSGVFFGLDSDSAKDLVKAMRPVRLDKGQILFREGDEGEKFYLIQTGRVKLGRSSPDGRENLLAILGAGEMLGEVTLFDPGPRTATATAVVPTDLLELSHGSMVEWLDRHPEAAKLILAALANRLRRTNENLADLVFSDVPGRVAKVLLDLATRFGEQNEDGIRVSHGLTQDELAKLVGASRETVNKALADFIGRGWLRLEGRSVVLLDLARLRKRAW
ncbi:MAG: Crp/Fnr family transcriptional regulator [Bifidobacteriaceae bacterium]|nr:Crp/Fnr family transcriptional regulator [Bifidobacteriaceae bacterium]